MFRQSIRQLATAATTTPIASAAVATTAAGTASAAATTSSASTATVDVAESTTTTTIDEPVFHNVQPAKYTLGSLRAFPSLNPFTFIPLPAKFFTMPERKDILWSAVVFEADGERVGSNWAPTKGDKLFSNRKVRPQKGTGRARLGDANSPHLYNAIKAHVIQAPHDWSTELPDKIYSKAWSSAFSEQYKAGNLFIIGADPEGKVQSDRKGDGSIVDFNVCDPLVYDKFAKSHNVKGKGLLFITNSKRDNLSQSAKERDSKKFIVKTKEDVDVRDILKANRIYVELPALQWIIGKHTV
ncbi:yml6 [[Candida] subhashii]|uniref:Large ribosomal subunit protein uL4m n=1 Tax=[Candida] subhashii TaxID=561895 RepID=A0A8J5UJ08_9ASCO|nr:yml6 [[Candida] subhashii]KAG7660646.1 yml6 [[Candida] subhashii]